MTDPVTAELVVACDGCGRLMAPEAAHLPHLADCRGGLCLCPDRWFCSGCCSECRPVAPLPRRDLLHPQRSPGGP